MKTTTLKNVRENKRSGVQFGYILDCIQSEEKELITDKEKVDYFFACFEIEHNGPYYKRAIPNEQDRISDYLQGLPSCCSVDYYNEDIVNIGKSWGFCQTARKEQEFIDKWFSVLAYRLIQLREYFNK